MQTTKYQIDKGLATDFEIRDIAESGKSSITQRTSMRTKELIEKNL